MLAIHLEYTLASIKFTLVANCSHIKLAPLVIDHQKEHHAVGSLSRKMEYTTDWEAHSESREAGVLGVRAD